MPDLSLEKSLPGRIAGVDEAGRGPWAGPVVAAAVILPEDLPLSLVNGLDDSKRLSAKAREYLFMILMQHADVGLGASSVSEITQYNILGATHRAMTRALEGLSDPPDVALIDGNSLPKSLPCPAQAIVGGDAQSLSIAGASIVAKVTRDRIMSRLARRYPDFGWESNAGYGTPQHRAGLTSAGVSPHHRRSFAPIARLISEHS